MDETMSTTNKQVHAKSLFGNVQTSRTGYLFIFLVCSVFNFSCKHKKQAENKIYTDNQVIGKVRSLFDVNQFDRGNAYLDSAYAVFPNPGIFDIWSKYEAKVAYYLNYKRKPARAQLYIDSMFTILKGNEQEFGVEYVRTLIMNGDILIAEGKYEQAFGSYYDGRLFAESHLDLCSSYELTNRLGLTLYRQGKYLKAIPYIKKCMIENSYCKGTIGDVQQSSLNTIALCFEKAGKLDSAIFYYKKALTYIDQNVNLFSGKGKFAEMARGVVYGNLGGTYSALGNYSLAERYLKASIDINDRPGYIQQDAKTAQIKLVYLYLKFSHFKEAELLMHQIGADLDAGRGKPVIDDDILLRWKKLKWEYFDKIKDDQEAYKDLKSYYSFSDSLNEAKKDLERVDLDEGLKETGERYRIDLLNKSTELKTTYLLAIIVFSVLILIILMMAWYNLKRSRKNVHELTNLNRLISDYNLQMQSALTALEQSYEENANIIKIVAHDLRAPIGGITIAVSKMLEQTNRSENDQSMLRLIQTSGKDSLALVSDLLKTHSSLKEIKKEPVDMYSLLAYCVSFMRLKAEEKEQKLELDAGHFTLFINRGNIWRVICNLIANAIKFSPPGSTINVLMLKKEDNVLITVDDCGIGIPDNMRDKIFDMFTEAKRQGTTGEEPFGIGLAISKQIVEMHGGKIWFEDKKAATGTLFHVELPIQYLN